MAEPKDYLPKLVMHTGFPAFKNNNVFEDSFNISGSIGGGVNLRTFEVNLGFTPDIVDFIVGQDGEYSKETSSTGRYIEVPGNGTSSGSITTLWTVGTRISDSTLIITAFNVHQVNETVNLTTTQIDFRVIDYSGMAVSDKILFDSRLNYMKRGLESDGLVGSKEINVSGSGQTVSHTINHGLGYIPFFVVGGYINDKQTIWSSNYIWDRFNSTGFDSNMPAQLWHKCNTQRLEINITNGIGSGEISDTRTIWWAIYLDYSK